MSPLNFRVQLSRGLLRLLTCTIATAAVSASTATAETFVVIAHEANSERGAGELLKSLYLKQRTKWPSGQNAKPYGRKAGSDAQKAILQMLGMSESQLAKHWIDVKQKTGQTPPKGVGSDRLLAKMVGKDEGAFGVVSKEAAEKAEGIKILTEIK